MVACDYVGDGVDVVFDHHGGGVCVDGTATGCVGWILSRCLVDADVFRVVCLAANAGSDRGVPTVAAPFRNQMKTSKAIGLTLTSWCLVAMVQIGAKEWRWRREIVRPDLISARFLWKNGDTMRDLADRVGHIAVCSGEPLSITMSRNGPGIVSWAKVEVNMTGPVDPICRDALVTYLREAGGTIR